MAIIVVNWNTRDLLRECLASLKAAGTGAAGQTPVIVVDNASTDGSVEMLSERFPEVQATQMAENAGYAAAANAGLRETAAANAGLRQAGQDGGQSGGADLVLVLNSDTTVEPGALEALAGFMESTPDAGAAGPAILNPDGTAYESGRPFLSFPKGAIHLALGYTGLWPNNPVTRAYKLTDWDRSEARRVDWVSGAALALRMEAAGQVGFFDEGYHMYMEDMDLCYRLKAVGWNTYYVPTARVVHQGGASTSKYPPLGKVARHIQSAARYYRKAGWSGRPHGPARVG